MDAITGNDEIGRGAGTVGEVNGCLAALCIIDNLNSPLVRLQLSARRVPDMLVQNLQKLGAVNAQLANAPVGLVLVHGADGNNLVAVVPASQTAVDAVAVARDGVCGIEDAVALEDAACVDADADAGSDLLISRCLFVDGDVLERRNLCGQR